MGRCDCRGEYLYRHGSRRLFPVNSVTGIQDNNLGLLSWSSEFISDNWQLKAFQNCFSASLGSADLNTVRCGLVHGFTDGNSISENRAKVVHV